MKKTVLALSTVMALVGYTSVSAHSGDRPVAPIDEKQPETKQQTKKVTKPVKSKKDKARIKPMHSGDRP